MSDCFRFCKRCGEETRHLSVAEIPLRAWLWYGPFLLLIIALAWRRHCALCRRRDIEEANYDYSPYC